MPMNVLTVCVDFKSVECYLAVAATLRLCEKCKPTLVVDWKPFPIRETEFGAVDFKTQKALVEGLKSKHFTRKNPYLLRLARYETRRARMQFRPPRCHTLDTVPALAGLLYLTNCKRQTSEQQVYIQACFAGVFGDNNDDISSVTTVQRIIARATRSNDLAAAFRVWWRASNGRELVHLVRKTYSERYNVFSVPSFILRTNSTGARSRTWPLEKYLGSFEEGGEFFTGRWSMDLIRRCLVHSGHLRASLTPRQPPSPPRQHVATPRLSVDCYLDMKSPYAYLAIAKLRQARADYAASKVKFDFLPFPLDIPSFLGSARVGPKDNIVRAHKDDKRSSKQWRAVKYAYADVRRRAALRVPPLTIFGTQKIWDSTLSGAALLWLRDHHPEHVDRWHDVAWPLFWKRKLNIEVIQHHLIALTSSQKHRYDLLLLVATHSAHHFIHITRTLAYWRK